MGNKSKSNRYTGVNKKRVGELRAAARHCNSVMRSRRSGQFIVPDNMFAITPSKPNAPCNEEQLESKEKNAIDHPNLQSSHAVQSENDESNSP